MFTIDPRSDYQGEKTVYLALLPERVQIIQRATLFQTLWLHVGDLKQTKLHTHIQLGISERKENIFLSSHPLVVSRIQSCPRLDCVKVEFKGAQSYHFSLFFTGSVIHTTFLPVTVGITAINLSVVEQERRPLKDSSYSLVFTASAFVSDQPRSIRVDWKSAGQKGVKIDLVRLVKKQFFLFKVDTTDLPSTDCGPLSRAFCR